MFKEKRKHPADFTPCNFIQTKMKLEIETESAIEKETTRIEHLKRSL